MKKLKGMMKLETENDVAYLAMCFLRRGLQDKVKDCHQKLINQVVTLITVHYDVAGFDPKPRKETE